MRLTVFDLDHTLIKANSSFRFGFFLYKAHFFSFWTLLSCLSDYARHKWFGMSIKDLHGNAFVKIFKGRSYSEICRLADQFLSESSSSLQNNLVAARLKKCQEARAHILLLSSSPDFLVERFASHFQVSDFRATVYNTDTAGKFSSISQVMEGENKAHCLKAMIDQLNIPQSAITVYSDSHLDLPILNMAGEPICVGPDCQLMRICLQKGWEILK
jgi:HAD superfamily phosphoserine phosphatase-like hydrolase